MIEKEETQGPDNKKTDTQGAHLENAITQKTCLIVGPLPPAENEKHDCEERGEWDTEDIHGHHDHICDETEHEVHNSPDHVDQKHSALEEDEKTQADHNRGQKEIQDDCDCAEHDGDDSMTEKSFFRGSLIIFKNQIHLTMPDLTDGLIKEGVITDQAC